MTDPVGVPLLVHAADLPVLCVGGGPVAWSKLRALLDAGARVLVVAPDVVDDLRQQAAGGRLQWEARAYVSDDVGRAALVLAATGSPDLNARVAADAAALGRLCVRVDDGAAGTASFMAKVRRGPLLFAVSTSGAAPALSAHLRRELGDRYGPEYGRLAVLCGRLRREPGVREALDGLGAKQRRARWHALFDTDILDLVRHGKLVQAKEVAYACLSSSSD